MIKVPKSIKNPRDIKPGFHIRAVVNCYGETWIEVLNVVGQKFTSPAAKKCLGVAKSAQQIKIKTKTKYKSYTDTRYIGDMIGYKENMFFKFSNKTYQFLNNLLLNDNLAFIKFVKNIDTEQQYKNDMEYDLS